jgi:hypothetical protein
MNNGGAYRINLEVNVDIPAADFGKSGCSRGNIGLFNMYRSIDNAKLLQIELTMSLDSIRGVLETACVVVGSTAAAPTYRRIAELRPPSKPLSVHPGLPDCGSARIPKREALEFSSRRCRGSAGTHSSC